ncbi:unnamed protein product [Camellia sinensis]
MDPTCNVFPDTETSDSINTSTGSASRTWSEPEKVDAAMKVLWRVLETLREEILEGEESMDLESGSLWTWRVSSVPFTAIARVL